MISIAHLLAVAACSALAEPPKNAGDDGQDAAIITATEFVRNEYKLDRAEALKRLKEAHDAVKKSGYTKEATQSLKEAELYVKRSPDRTARRLSGKVFFTNRTTVLNPDEALPEFKGAVEAVKDGALIAVRDPADPTSDKLVRFFIPELKDAKAGDNVPFVGFYRVEDAVQVAGKKAVVLHPIPVSTNADPANEKK